MNKSTEELQAELKETNAKIEQNAVDLAAVQANRSTLEADIEALKAKLAEEQKPKLRHGDYVLWKTERSSDDDPLEFIAIEVNEKLHWFSRIPSISTGWKDCGLVDYTALDDFVVLGNIFDDLKALQEDVTEFEASCHNCSVDSLKVSLAKKGERFHLEMGNESMYIGIAKIPAFVLAIRQMEATLKRKAAK